MYYVYILKSIKDSKLYIGHTKNLTNRIKQHNQGLVEATQKRRPLKIVYYEASNILEDAIRREASLKTGFGRAYLKRRLQNI
ncbi:GIY-YIG nuclease family protein [Patescibacteria group bacterium]|nr:GIY-YIG nuclease family protein [Patescibacteria group bacterium]